MKNAKRLLLYGAQLLIPHIKFSMGSHHVPQVFNMFPILFPIAPHFIPYPSP
jgi:hypothetical protein